MDNERDEREETNYPDDGADFLCTPREPLVILNELLQLKRESIANKSLYRQLILIDEFLSAYPTSFYMADLTLVMEMLEKLVEDLPNVPQYHIPLQLLFEHAENLPLLRCSSEMLKYGDVLKEYFNLWSYFLLEIEYEDMLYQVAKILLSLLQSEPTNNSNQINKNMIIPAIEKSNLPVVISELLLDADEHFYKLLLKVAIELSMISHDIPLKMVEQGTVSDVILRLDPQYKTRSLSEEFSTNLTINDISNLHDTTKLLWYLADSVQYYQRTDLAPITQKGWTSFRYTITILVRDQRAKLERNFLMACLLKGFFVYPSINFYSTRLPDDFCQLCTSTEFEIGDTWTTNIRHSKEILDYNFKKIMLLGVAFLAQTGITEPIRRCNVMATLIRLINPELNTQWKSRQYCKMLHLALCVCILVLPPLIDEFIKFNGPLKLISTLNYYQIHQYEYDILMTCLRLTWTAVRTNDENVLEIFKENGIVTTLTNIGNLLLQNQNLSMSKQNCLMFSFLISELMFKGGNCSQIDLLKFGLDYLYRLVNPHRDDGFHDSKVAISCISCLWESIKSNEDNLKYFVSNNGVYVLLDTIEKSLETVQIVGLGMLVDLCEDESTLPYVLTWRKDGKRYMNLLMDIVRKENKRLNVKIANSGVLEDIYHPLMGEMQYIATYNYEKPFDSSPSIMDMYGSTRPKVYAIIGLLLRHEPVVTIINERYKIQTEELPIQDEVTLLLIEHFLPLKLGEVWCEIAESIKTLGTQLIGIDDNLITTLKMRLPVMAQHIQCSQIALLKEKYAKETVKERGVYDKLKDIRLGASLAAMSEVHYIARTTESLFRMIQKMRQRTFIDSANLPYSKVAEHHNTFQYSINVNPVFKQHITMYKSDTDKKLIKTIKEVSLCNSTENLLDIKDDKKEPLYRLE